MKTSIAKFIFAVAAAAALAFSSCNTQENGISGKPGIVFNVSAERPALDAGAASPLKTSWTGTTVGWSAGDAVSMAIAADDVWQGSQAGHPSIYPSDPLTAASETATFRVPTDLAKVSGSSIMFYGISPALSGTGFSSAPNVTVTLPKTQTPPAGSFAPETDILVGHSTKSWSSVPETVSMIWERVVAHADITISNLALASGEKVNSITLQAQNGAALAGDLTVDITTGAVSVSEPSSKLVVNASNLNATASGIEFWAVMLPVKITALNVKVDTDKATYTRNITDLNLDFLKNARNLLTINMSTAERKDKTQYYTKVTAASSDWSGEYLIVYEDGSLALNGALSSIDASGNYISVDINDGKVVANAASKAAAFTFAKSGNGYSIKGTSGKFIGASSNSNTLQASNTALENTVTYSGSNGALVKGTAGAVLRYNTAGTRFRYYKSSSYEQQAPIQLYKLTAVEDDEDEPVDPEFNASLKTVAASGITSSSATLNASYSGIDLTEAPQDVVFKWGKSENSLDNTVGNITVSETSGTYSWNLSELSPGTTYWFKAEMSVWNPVAGEYKTISGATLSFKTLSAQPSSGKLDWAELPSLDYIHYTAGGGNYYVDNSTHGGKYASGSLYYTHHWTSETYPSPSTTKIRNYTVCWSSDHICPVWVAAPRHSIWEGGSSPSRNYKLNPDMPDNVQYNATSANNDSYNRGHMLGAAERNKISSAFAQVNYVTNIAPQEGSYFNTGGGGWNTLEDWVDGQVCSDTLYVVIGCLFDKVTDGYGNTASPSKINYMSTPNVSCPTAFYYILLRTKGGSTGKSVKDCSASELKCAAFLRAHAPGTKGQDVTSKEMMSVSDLEAMTGFNYFPNVPNAPKSEYKASDWGL